MSPEPFRKTLTIETEDIAGNLGLKSGEIDPGFSVSVINAGLTTLLVPVKGLDSVLGIYPDQERLKKFCVSNNLDIIEVFTPEVADVSSDYRTRVFAPAFGYIEDPATGSGNSAFGYYLLDNGLFNKNTVIIEQNGSRERFNVVKLRKQPDENGNERILFGGGGVTRIEGKYFLH